MTDPIDLRATYVHLKESGATAVPTGPEFWPDLIAGRTAYPGRLALIQPMTADFPHWERHPAGEELIVMLSGACEMILEDDERERRVTVRAGEAILVPTNVWHRAVVIDPGEALFVTEGEGTDHKPIE